MGRRARVVDPSTGPVAALAKELRDLRDQPRDRGPKLVPGIAAATGRSRSALYAALPGDVFPEWPTVEALVTAWGGDPGSWRLRWETAQAELANGPMSSSAATGLGGGAAPAEPTPLPTSEQTQLAHPSHPTAETPVRTVLAAPARSALPSPAVAGRNGSRRARRRRYPALAVAAVCAVLAVGSASQVTAGPSVARNVAGRVTCAGGEPVEGVYVVDPDGGSGFANVSGAGSTVLFRRHMPNFGGWTVHVGCGGTPGRWLYSPDGHITTAAASQSWTCEVPDAVDPSACVPA